MSLISNGKYQFFTPRVFKSFANWRKDLLEVPKSYNFFPTLIILGLAIYEYFLLFILRILLDTVQQFQVASLEFCILRYHIAWFPNDSAYLLTDDKNEEWHISFLI